MNANQVLASISADTARIVGTPIVQFQPQSLELHVIKSQMWLLTLEIAWNHYLMTHQEANWHIDQAWARSQAGRFFRR